MVDTLATGRIVRRPSFGGDIKYLIGTASKGNGGSIQLSDPMRNIIYANASVIATTSRGGSLTYNVRGSSSGKYLLVSNIYHSFGTKWSAGTPQIASHGGTTQAHGIGFIIFGK